MRRRLWLLLPILAFSLLCLSGCGGAGQPRPTPEPTPAPILEFPDGTAASVDAESLDLSGIQPGDTETALELLESFSALRELKLGDESGFTPEQAAALQAKYPEGKIDYTLRVAGQDCPLDAVRLDLSGLRGDETEETARRLRCMSALRKIELGEEREDGPSWEQIAALEEAAPQADFAYQFTLYELPFSLDSREIDINHIPVEDRGELVCRVLRCMPKLERLIMDSCGVANEDMAAIRDAFPEVEVVWRVNFGWTYSVRTDVERILASKSSWGGEMTGEDVQVLQYCTKVRFLDLGHNNNIDDISFVRYMPELEVFIIAMNSLVDVSPLEACPKLEYLELFYTYVEDLSPLSGLTELRHLNISGCWNLKDITPLYGLELERLYIGALTPVPTEQVEEYRKLHPDCEVDDELYEGSWGTWRFADEASTELVPRYALLREQFDYDNMAYSVYWLDPNY